MTLLMELAPPIMAGIMVSLINRYIVGNQSIINCCQSTYEGFQQSAENIEETDNSSENSAISADYHRVVHYGN